VSHSNDNRRGESREAKGLTVAQSRRVAATFKTSTSGANPCRFLIPLAPEGDRYTKYPRVRPCLHWKPVSLSVGVAHQLAPDIYQVGTPVSPVQVSPDGGRVTPTIVSEGGRQPGLLSLRRSPHLPQLYRYSSPEDISACRTITQDISARISCRITAPSVVSGCVATASTESYRYVSKAVRYRPAVSISAHTGAYP